MFQTYCEVPLTENPEIIKAAELALKVYGEQVPPNIEMYLVCVYKASAIPLNGYYYDISFVALFKDEEKKEKTAFCDAGVVRFMRTLTVQHVACNFNPSDEVTEEVTSASCKVLNGKYILVRGSP